MIGARDILLGVLLPAAVAGMMVLAGLLAGNRWWLRRALVPLAIGAGFAAGYAALLRVPAFPPLDTIHWLFYAAAAIGIVAAVDAVFWGATSHAADAPAGWDEPRPSRALEYGSFEGPTSGRASIVAWIVRAVLLLGLSVLLVWLLAEPLLVFHWTGATGPIWIGGIAVTMAGAWLSLDTLAARMTRSGEGMTLALTLSLVAGVSSLTIALSGTQKLGQLGGMLTAAMFAVTVLGLFLPRATQVGRGMVLVFVMLHTALVAAATEHLFASMTMVNAILLVIAGPLAWVGEVVPGRGTWGRAVVRVVVAVAPAGVAAILAGIAFARASVSI